MNAVSQNKSQTIGAGALFGLVGMNVYYIPVTKDRFVRTAFNIIKQDTEDKVEFLNQAAAEISNNKLKTENKLRLAQLGISENIDDINAKCIDLMKSVTDNDAVKALKKNFDDNFKNFKKSEAIMDNISSKAFSNIRWSNFAWGTAIGFVIGAVFGSMASRAAQPQNAQIDYFK